MQIILLEDIERLGVKGSIVDVKNGYGRNYLIPQEKALPATPHNIEKFKHLKDTEELRRSREKAHASNLLKKIESLSLTAVAKAGEDDKLFGSVTSHTVSELLKKEGIKIDKKDILLSEPIKELGVYTIPVRLLQDMEAKLKLWVVKE